MHPLHCNYSSIGKKNRPLRRQHLELKLISCKLGTQFMAPKCVTCTQETQVQRLLVFRKHLLTWWYRRAASRVPLHCNYFFLFHNCKCYSTSVVVNVTAYI